MSMEEETKLKIIWGRYCSQLFLIFLCFERS